MLQLHNWCSANKLEINPTNSAATIIPAKLHDLELDLNFFIITKIFHVTIPCYNKYLGVIIDNKLNFKTHIHNVENKVSRSVRILPSSDSSFLPKPFSNFTAHLYTHLNYNTFKIKLFVLYLISSLKHL